MRWMEAFLPGEGVGGAASHWNGHWRWSEYDPTLRTRYESRYGKAAIPADMPLQDWGTTYRGARALSRSLRKALRPVAGRRATSRRRSCKRAAIRSRRRAATSIRSRRSRSPRRARFSRTPRQTLGYKPFPVPAANSSGVYLNPDGQRLGHCQYCGHCERFVCEAHAKGTPDTLLYPVLSTRASFELRTRAQVLHVDYDRHHEARDSACATST